MPTPAQQRIIAAATRLYAEAGFAAVSQRTLAAEVGIQAPSLYSTFTSQAEILEAVCQPYLEAYAELLRQSAHDNQLTVGLAYLFRRNREQVLIAHHDPAVRLTAVGKVADALDTLAVLHLGRDMPIERAWITIGALRSREVLADPERTFEAAAQQIYGLPERTNA